MANIPNLKGPSLPPLSGGEAKQIIILLHGVGSDGDDLIGLAPYFQKILPDALFVVDLANETTAITEAQKLGIPVIGLADSNVNPEGIDFLIPGNDDAIRSIELIASAIADACLKGSGKRDQVENKESE